MLEKIMSFARHPARIENRIYACADGAAPVEDVRAVATEAALAAAVDVSPAVLVTLWAHDQRLHPEHRPAVRRSG
jgi:hypothetical protein